MPQSFLAIDPTLITLVSVLAAMGLVLGATVTWAAYRVRLGRLPAATRNAAIAEELAIKRADLAAAQARLDELQQKEHERDRLAAEVDVLERRLGEARLEYENLAGARAEIAQVKTEAANAVAEKAEAIHELQALSDQAAALRAELDPERIARLQREAEEAADEYARIIEGMPELRIERDEALRIVGEARAMETRVEALETRRSALVDEIAGLEAQHAPLADEVAEARTQLETARRGRDEALEETERAARQLARLDADVAAIEAEAERAEREITRLEAQIESLNEKIDDLRQNRSKIIAGTATAAGGDAGPMTDADVQAALADLVAAPECLRLPDRLRPSRPSEADALHHVARHLRELGLTFHSRTLRAFHTALKVNDTAQLTVLAGVSGTGKSLLPRRYAEAMGIHFLQVAVEPRWDSPQDLLGFYNYVERKYRATELSRLLVHLDPWKTLDLPPGSPERDDHMALVLLDEMNLARVEYYFSEFLSRLEARPPWRDGLALDDCADAMIPVDIRGMENPPRLFPAHNVLFVGTMNDDESTQSLSDKVLDRGNILQFPAPAEFPPPADPVMQEAGDAQSFGEWRSWVRGPRAQIGPAAADHARDVIRKLAVTMQKFGRPFGHRLNQAIHAYVANYPTEGNAGLDASVPLADQIEFRILPKLRGVEIDAARGAFDDLDRVVRHDLGDSILADCLKSTCEEQAQGSGLFVWRGLDRGA